MANEHGEARAEWQAVAGGWRRWEPLFQSFTWPVALRMATTAQIGDGKRVLDLGCGIGDPTLQVAVLVGPHGRVLGIDLSEDMIVTAKERAAALGLAHVEFRSADVTTLDLAPGTFDVVLGRWSVIYMRDVTAMLGRVRKALVSGGRIALTAWAPPVTNPWITIPMAALGAVRPMPAPDPREPGVFHLSGDGELAGTLRAAGFRGVHQERVKLSQFTRDAAEFWAMLTDMGGGGPLAPHLAQLTPAERERAARGVAEGIAPFRAGDVYRIPAEAQLAWAEA